MSLKARSSRDVIIRTADLAAAVFFYESTLGFKVSACGEGLFGIETGSITFYVEEGPAHGPVFEFLVADVAAAKARLLAEGCMLVEEDCSVPRCYVKDPYGVTFNIGKASTTPAPPVKT